MDIKKILVIFLLITIYSIVFWPTLTIYTHTSQNILVKINRITGEAYYCTYDKWRKIEVEKITATKKYGSVEILPLPDEFVPYEEFTGGVKRLNK